MGFLYAPGRRVLLAGIRESESLKLEPGAWWYQYSARHPSRLAPVAARADQNNMYA
jgi:hypothetical protein